MLQSLSIKNYTLINALDINFSNGFSVITGETGSGKSILLGALGLVLGQRAEGNILKDTSKKCAIECTFNISKYHLKKFFEKNELDYDEETIIRREILPNGKSRAFINDSPVKIRILRELGFRLVDIHSQNQNLTLENWTYQMEVIDSYAKNSILLRTYQDNFKQYSHLQQELQQQQEKAEQEKADLDYFQFQLEQLTDANLQEDEQQEMENELEMLNHAEEIKTGLYHSYGIISDSETSVLSQLRDARHAVEQIKSVYPDAATYYERINSAFIDLQDLSYELNNANENIEFDAGRIDFLTERLDTIYTLQQKHRVDSVAELLEIQEKLEQKVTAINSNDSVIKELKQQLKKQHQQLTEIAEKLTNSRKKSIPKIEKNITKQLVMLGIPNANFKIDFTNSEEFHQMGCDNVNFLFTANKNGRLEPVQQVASGGEISRLMLSIKHLISASTALPSIVFDEIDTGVSGEIADKMGEMMTKMSENIQVISITHLPQIAGKGQYHYKVFKTDDEFETYSNIVLLNKEDRLKELAKMLSGSNITDAALQNARVLLNPKNQ